MSNNFNLPNPYPCAHPRLRELSFAALSYLSRAADAAGSDRFDETIVRARFYIAKAATHATTPAQRAVLEGMSASVDAIIAADADMREVLTDAVAGISEACAAECDRLLESADG